MRSFLGIADMIARRLNSMNFLDLHLARDLLLAIEDYHLNLLILGVTQD